MQNEESRICQKCQSKFEVCAADFEFYNKISVPPPSFCPDCRLQRRLCFRNERVLYSRKCDAPGHDENIVTVFHPDSPYKVYDNDYWWSDKWDPLEYGQEYDFNKPFFEQLLELQAKVPRLAVAILKCENCDYTNFVANSKDSYLIVSAEKCENCYFGLRNFYSRDCAECENIDGCELCYECFQCTKCYKCTFSQKLENCRDLHFCFDCRGSSNCFGSTGLRNKSFYFYNKKLSEEEYAKKLDEAKKGSYAGITELLEKSRVHHLKFPRRFAEVVKSENCTGDNIFNSQNCRNSYVVNGSKNLSNVLFGTQAFDTMDSTYSDFCEQVYETISSEHDSKKSFTYMCWESSNLQYCDACHSSSSDLFGCIGLNHKQYCILNKQYTQEEYEKIVPKIIEQINAMPYTDSKGREYRYGEFFPYEYSNFAYNESVAQEYFPLSKEEALEQGFKWRDIEKKNHEITIEAENLPDTVEAVTEEILKETIGCEHQGNCSEPCTQAFKIVGRELELYKRLNVPLPHLCPICRHYQRAKFRNPLKVWQRKCQCAGLSSENSTYKNITEHQHHGTNPCPNKFETTYSNDRPETIYCEQCYLEEAS